MERAPAIRIRWILGEFLGNKRGRRKTAGREPLAAGDKSSACSRTAVGRHVLPIAIGVDVADANSNARQDVQTKSPLEDRGEFWRIADAGVCRLLGWIFGKRT
jgi:hypothetical protein